MPGCEGRNGCRPRSPGRRIGGAERLPPRSRTRVSVIVGTVGGRGTSGTGVGGVSVRAAGAVGVGGVWPWSGRGCSAAGLAVGGGVAPLSGETAGVGRDGATGGALSAVLAAGAV